MGRQVSVLSFVAIFTVISGAALRGATPNAAPQDAVARAARPLRPRVGVAVEAVAGVGDERRRARRRRQAVGRVDGDAGAAGKETEAFRAELATIDRDALPAAEQANYDIFATPAPRARRVVRASASIPHRSTPTPASTPASPLLRQAMPFADGQGLRELHRAACAPSRATCDQNIALMREGLKRGMTAAARSTLAGYRDVASSRTPSTMPTKSVFWTPFTRIPAASRPASASGCAKAGRDGDARGASCRPTRSSSTS